VQRGNERTINNRKLQFNLGALPELKKVESPHVGWEGFSSSLMMNVALTQGTLEVKVWVVVIIIIR